MTIIYCDDKDCDYRSEYEGTCMKKTIDVNMRILLDEEGDELACYVCDCSKEMPITDKNAAIVQIETIAGKYCNGAELDSVIRCIELLKR